MRKIFLMCSLAACCYGQAQSLRTPAPSPPQTVKQDFGISSIEVSYSRPGIKGRKIFGELVPFGKVWRTGANNATTITFGDDVLVAGKKIAAGKYGLLTIPDGGNWTVIISKQLDVTSPAAYKQDMDVARIEAKPMAMREPVQNFTIQFDDVKSSSCNLSLTWENTAVSIPIETDVDSKVMGQIDEMFIKDNRPYYNAAAYYIDNGKDLGKALEWLNKATDQNPKAYWAWYQKANCLAKMGKKSEAAASAHKSIEVAKEAKNDDYVALNEKLLATLK